jgi:hypothetical protein
LSAPRDGIFNVLNGRNFRIEWSGFFSYAHPDYYYTSTVAAAFSQIPPGSCYIDEIARTFAFREIHATISATLYRDYC